LAENFPINGTRRLKEEGDEWDRDNLSIHTLKLGRNKFKLEYIHIE
jgi:hypothetical protein